MLPKTACALAREAHRPQRSARTKRALKLTAFFIEFPPTTGKPVECLTTELESTKSYYSLVSSLSAELSYYNVVEIIRDFQISAQL
jgi:hypothetical protein